MPVSQELIDKIGQYEKEGYDTDSIVEGLSQSKNYPDIANKIKVYRKQGYANNDILEGIRTSPLIKTPQKPIQQPSFYQKWVKPIAEPTTEALGLIGGGALGLAGGGPVGAVAGAGLGYAGAKQAYRAGEEFAGVKQPEPVGQQLVRTGKEIATGAEMEMLGGIGGKAISAMTYLPRDLWRRGWSKLLQRGLAKGDPELMEAEKALFKETGTILTPAQKTESGVIDTLEEMGRGAITSRQLFQKYNIAQEEGLKKFTQNIVDDFWKTTGQKLSPSEAGTLLKDTLEGGESAFKATAKGMYQSVDNLTGNAKIVNLDEIKTFANDIMQKAIARKGIGASKAGDSLVRRIMKLDSSLTFSEAQELRSALLTEERYMGATADKARGLASKFVGFVDDAMEQGSKQLPKDAIQAWRSTNQFYRRGKEFYNDNLIQKLADKVRPEDVQTFFNKVSDVKLIKSNINKKTFDTLKGNYLEKLITDTTSPEGFLMGKGFINKLNKMPKELMNEIFTPQEANRLYQAGRIAMAMQSPTKGGGGMLIQLMQGSALIGGPIGAVTGRPELLAGTALFAYGPREIAKIFTNPEYATTFVKAMRTPIGSSQTGGLLIKLMGIKREMEKERPIEEYQKLQGESTLR